MTHSVPPWVEEAAGLPVAFAQVREDALLDRWVIEQHPNDARVLLVASGGCTAAALAGAPNLAALHLVDPNPAQLALARLKLRLLQTCPPARRMAVLGHAPMPADERRRELAADLDALGPADFVARVGPDYAGRYEAVFAALRQALGDRAGGMDEVLILTSPTDQARRAAPDTALGRRLDEALDQVMALPNLVRLFGAEATNNPVEPFARHFAGRIRHALATMPAATNPYLWQMLRGAYPPGAAVPWLDAPPPARMPAVTFERAFMIDALQARDEGFDFIHLSNILDWLTPEKVRLTLERAWRALRPGGWTLIRQLNSTLDIPALGPAFDWLGPEAGDLHARDRSFFYRALHLGRRR